MAAGDVLRHFRDDLRHLMRHGAAIGVAQHHPARTGVVGCFCAGQRELRVLLVAVEEMLAVEHHLAARFLGGHDTVADRGEVLLVGGLQRDADLIGGRLRDKTDRVGVGFKQAGDAGIVGDRAPCPPRHAKRGEAGVVELGLRGKKLGIGRIGAGISALDIVDAEIVEHVRDGLLVAQREVDAVGLRAVAQRGVEQIETLAAHGLPPRIFCMVVLASHSPLTVMLLRCMAT